MTEPLRRLPVYLVLDCSGSMSGEPIEAVRQGVRALLSDLKSDPQALETVYLSVITFAGSAVQACPLTALDMFQEPILTAGGSTAFGEALRLVAQCVDTEVRKPSTAQGVKGDWKPLIFLMTDGIPTDNWEPAADSLRNRHLGQIIACAAGDGADPTVLQHLTTNGDGSMVVQLKSLRPDALKAFLKWVSGSVKTTSQGLAGGTPSAGLPPPPPGVVVVP